MLKVKFEFDKKSLDYIERLPEKATKALQVGLRKAMFFAEGKAKAGFAEGGPVRKPPGPLVARTGHLRRSIKSRVDPRATIGWIGSDVVYARRHELGTGGMPARPFLRPALSGDNLSKISDIIKEALWEGFK